MSVRISLIRSIVLRMWFMCLRRERVCFICICILLISVLIIPSSIVIIICYGAASSYY